MQTGTILGAVVIAALSTAAAAADTCTGMFGDTATSLELVGDNVVNYTFGNEVYANRPVGSFEGQPVFWVSDAQTAWVVIGERNGADLPIVWQNTNGNRAETVLNCASETAAQQMATVGQ